MERNLNNDDFEHFLKAKTDHYKLYPSDNVWKGIYKSLHSRRKWFTIGGSLLLFSGLLFLNSQFNDRSSAINVQKNKRSTESSNVSTTKNSLEKVAIASSVIKTAIPGRNKSRAHGINLIGNELINSPIGQTEFEIKTISATQDLTEIPYKPDENLNINKSKDREFTSDESISNSTSISANIMAVSERELGTESDINWLQEMAAIKLTPQGRRAFNLQFYFSPTISYRKLADGNKIKGFTNAPLAISHLGVNNFVDHKPSIGVELGSNILFSPTKNLTLKTGLQFNYSRYSIKAYKFYFEKANIALMSMGRVADTMSSYTTIRNFNGYSPEELQNQYVQVSLPVGAELKLLGNKRLQLNVAGTIQPTYLLYNDTYLLSTDYVNYIKEPSLVRKWNVHTSAEAFVSYYIGGMRWQVGPQFRYQTLSSYNDLYPIKEYLIEYGIKFGVSKTLR
jgi:hypothetical protein